MQRAELAGALPLPDNLIGIRLTRNARMLLRVLDCELALIANDLAADLPAGQAQPDAQVAPQRIA